MCFKSLGKDLKIFTFDFILQKIILTLNSFKFSPARENKWKFKMAFFSVINEIQCILNVENK